MFEGADTAYFISGNEYYECLSAILHDPISTSNNFGQYLPVTRRWSPCRARPLRSVSRGICPAGQLSRWRSAEKSNQPVTSPDVGSMTTTIRMPDVGQNLASHLFEFVEQGHRLSRQLHSDTANRLKRVRINDSQLIAAVTEHQLCGTIA